MLEPKFRPEKTQLTAADDGASAEESRSLAALGMTICVEGRFVLAVKAHLIAR